MGLAVVQLAKRSFTNPSIRPSAWAPRKDKKPHKLLMETPGSGLYVSMRLLSVTDTAAHVGTDKDYAVYHQLGTGKMPARPFFPFDSNGKATPRAAEAVRRALEDRLRARMKA
jgi:phage gpG-like protein